MELSDSDEEIVDLNAENDKSKEEEKNDKSKSKLSSSKISKWIKPSLESLSQMAKSIPEDTENIDPNNTDQNYANFEMDNDEDNNDNAEDNQDKLSDYNNYNNDKDNNNNEYKDNNLNKMESYDNLNKINQKEILTEEEIRQKNIHDKIISDRKNMVNTRKILMNLDEYKLDKKNSKYSLSEVYRKTEFKAMENLRMFKTSTMNKSILNKWKKEDQEKKKYQIK